MDDDLGYVPVYIPRPTLQRGEHASAHRTKIWGGSRAVSWWFFAGCFELTLGSEKERGRKQRTAKADLGFRAKDRCIIFPVGLVC